MDQKSTLKLKTQSAEPHLVPLVFHIRGIQLQGYGHLTYCIHIEGRINLPSFFISIPRLRKYILEDRTELAFLSPYSESIRSNSMRGMSEIRLFVFSIIAVGICFQW